MAMYKLLFYNNLKGCRAVNVRGDGPPESPIQDTRELSSCCRDATVRLFGAAERRHHA